MPGIREIGAIARSLRRSGLESIDIQGDGYRLRLRYDVVAAPVAAIAPAVAAVPVVVEDAAPDAPAALALTAPMPGRIWLQDPLTGRDIAPEGQTLCAGDLLALLQAGPVCLALRAQAAGKLAGFEVVQGEPVEYGQTVAKIVPTEAEV